MVAFAVAACTPNPKASVPTASSALDLMFENKYSAAGSQLQDQIKKNPQDARAHAAYALLLNYQSRQRPALGEAQQAARLAPRDGWVLTVLTRVQDWNEQFAAATTSGAEAVKLSPQSTLAHAFYAEALADQGRFDEAQAQLKTAESLAPRSSAYDRAEVARNWGNYFRARRDYSQALDHFKQAANAQPQWVERLLELARFTIARQDLTAATGYLQRAAQLSPDDPSLREQLGEVALFGQDYQVAKSAFQAALKLQPRSNLDLKILGDIAVALDRDPETAIKDERAAIAIEPTDAEAGAYLVAVLRYLKGDSAGALEAARHSVVPPASGSVVVAYLDLDKAAADRQAAAITALNRFRKIVDIAPVAGSPVIHQSAGAHAYYTLFNGASPAIRDLGIHRESKDGQGFTGENVLTRAQHFGYPARAMAEVITHRADPEGAVTDWIDSVFHRVPLLRADLVEVGFGDAYLRPLSVQVMDLAYRPDGPATGRIVLYPAPDQQDVPPQFNGNEIPDPAPNAAYPVGYPITATFDRLARVRVTDWHLRDQGRVDLAGIALTPDKPEMENSFAFLANSPLQAGATYSMELNGTLNGTAFHRVWSFTTRSAAASPSPQQTS